MNMQQAVQSQYLAALKMLREAIVKCPPSVWDAPQDKDRFWFKVQHVLYWAHVDVRATSKDFVRWKGHHRPVAAQPAPKDELLAYLDYVERRIRHPRTPKDLIRRPGAGGSPFSQLGRAIASIRHIQQHTGELYERLGARENTVLHWTEKSR